MEKSILITVVLVGILKMGFVGCSSNSNETKSEQTKNISSYQCPMDCENGKTYTQAGKCPICDMDMEKK